VQCSGLPSWATDWMPPRENRLYFSRSWVHLYRYDWFNCDNREAIVRKADLLNSTLDLDGIFVDKIAQTGEPLMQDGYKVICADPLRSRLGEWRLLAGITGEELDNADEEVDKLSEEEIQDCV
jgi:hypothetical protein